MTIHKIILASIVIMLASCLSSKKADKQVGKIQSKYPEKIAAVCSEKYPCSTLKADTVYNVSEVVITSPADTITIDSTVYIDCPDKGAQVAVKVKYYYVNTRTTIEKTITEKTTKVVEDSSKVFRSIKDTQTLQKKLNNKNIFLWVLSAIVFVFGCIIAFFISKLSNPKKLL